MWCSGSRGFASTYGQEAHQQEDQIYEVSLLDGTRVCKTAHPEVALHYQRLSEYRVFNLKTGRMMPAQKGV